MAGGAISAATAATMTAMMGEAYIAALSYFFEADADASPSADEIAEQFKKQLTLRKKSK